MTMAQDECVSYPPIMKLQSLKISNTLLIKRVIHYISITKNWENDLQNTTKKTYKMTSNGFAYDFWFCHFKTWNWQKQENLKTLINTQNPLKTSLNNLIWSNPMVLEITLNFDQRSIKFNRLWRSLTRFDYSIFTIWPFDYHCNLQIQIFHKYFTHSTNPTVKFWILIWFHDGHV